MAKIELVKVKGYDVHLMYRDSDYNDNPDNVYIIDTDDTNEPQIFFVNNDPYNTSDNTLYTMGGNFKAWYYNSLHSQVIISGSTQKLKYNNNNFYGITLAKTISSIRNKIATSGEHAYKIYYQSDYNVNSSSNGSHTHQVTINNSGAHTHQVTINNSGAHTHKVTINNSGAHTHNVNGNTGNTGSGTALNTQDPYITVYMWKRVE